MCGCEPERNYFSIDFGMCLTRFFDLNKVVHVCVWIMLVDDYDDGNEKKNNVCVYIGFVFV